jgi:hypothetical protein
MKWIRRGDLAALLILAAVVSSGRFTYGQDKPVPPPRQVSVTTDSVSQENDSSLPKIDLPEYVITGTETINLPEFAKGRVDDARVFDGSSRKAPGQRESLRVSAGSPNKERIAFPTLAEGFTGKVIGTYGSYNTPSFDGWFGRTSGSSDFLLKSGYKSSSGHVANSDYHNGHASLEGGAYLTDGAGVFAGNRISGSLGFRGNAYRLYGSYMPNLQRSINRFLADVTMNSDMSNVFTYNSGVYIRRTSVEDDNQTSETAVGIEFTGNRDFEGFGLKGDAALWRNFYSAPSAIGDPYFIQLGLSARYQILEKVDVVGGGTFYLVRGSDTGSGARIYPRLSVSWYAENWLIVFARFEPYIQRNSLASTVESSPYVVNDARVRHPEYFNNFSLGTELTLSSSVKGRVSLNYKRVENLPIYVGVALPGVWRVDHFGTTRIISMEGEVYADITENDNLGATIAIRSSRNSDSDKAVPYLPLVLMSALYQHRFPIGLTLATSLQFIGKQYVDLQEQRSIASFTLLDIKAEYQIIPRLSAALMFDNLLDQKQIWWEGYAGLRRTVSLGMSYMW